MSDQSTNLANNLNDQHVMKPPMRIVVVIVFFLISILFLVIIADKVFTDIFTSIDKNTIAATITKVKITKSRSVSSYWIYYSFEVDNRNYERKSIFGRLKQGTEIRKSDANIYSEGAKIDVNYSIINPNINMIVNDPYKNDKNTFMIIGILLFGFIAINEIRNMMKLKKS